MDYRYLKAFMLTAKYTNFSRAAEELNIAQSAVSRQIKLLEDDLKTELIIRSSKKVTLTEKGKELYLAISNFNDFVDDIFRQIGKKPLRIGILHGLLESWLINNILKFYSRSTDNNYQVSLDIFVDAPNRLVEDLHNGKYDLIITTDNIQNELIISQHIFNEKLILISKNKLQVDQNGMGIISSDLKNILNHRWIIYDSNDNFFKLHKGKHDNYVKVNSMTAIKKLVMLGVGIAVVPDHIIDERDSHLLNKYPLSFLEEPGVYISTLNFKSYPPHLKKFMDVCCN